MVIIVGLGNPEAEYFHTYHNIGFDVVDAVAKKMGVEFSKEKFKALIAEGMFYGEKFMLVKPQTYMNRSGESLVLLKEKFKDARLLVVVDDIDLPKGNLRYREHGSAGTHNGLRSIVEFIGKEFERLKVGVGRDISLDLADYVLSKYDKEVFAPIIEKAAEQVLERMFA
ncbi:MAG: aminoacyl-tRNA hydrolase [Clostridia bacterium]|nr:aminoacyl-tRNA hydrolase [Clostridia bacterium]